MEPSHTLEFVLPLEGNPSQTPDITAYAFDRSGKLLARAPLREGRAALELSKEEARHARLFFAPTPPEGQEKPPTMAQLERARAYEPVWRFDPRQQVYDLLEVPRHLWRFWRWCRCRVRGRVVKPVTRGGVTVERPVCHARVHICEVDPWFILLRRVPDRDLFRLRDDLLRVIERHPFPIPEPDPGPLRFDPGFIDPAPERLAAPRLGKSLRATLAARLALGDEVTLNPQPLPPREGLHQMAGGATMLNPQPEPPGRAQGFDPQPDPPAERFVLPAAVHSALLSRSALTLREALLTHVELLRPWFCWLRWWWHWYRCDEVAVVETDAQGRFDVPIWYLCRGDRPDLYFWVEYNIGGVWTTVYHPPIPCYTYWNYPCGQEVTIRVTDPRVSVCDELPSVPGMQLALISVGEYVNVRHIQMSGGDAGLIPYTGAAMRPFGGSLEPNVWFGTGLIPAGITHFRWSYRPLGTPGDGGWAVLEQPVDRFYRYETGGTFVVKPLHLGPDEAIADAVLFKIPPQHPPVPTGEWATGLGYTRANQASGYFTPVQAFEGKYELKLELFRIAADGTPQRVNLTDEGIGLSVPPATVPAPLPDTGVTLDPAPAPYLYRPAGPGTDVQGFRLVLHVDNRPCEAEIYPVEVPGSAQECGFITFDPDSVPPPEATLRFRAHHPAGFATFSFSVVRGSDPVAIANSSGWIEDSAAALNGYAQEAAHPDAPHVFAKTFAPLNSLLGPCGKGAFAEHLYVDALATDGWGGPGGLDDAALAAFALLPQEEEDA